MLLVFNRSASGQQQQHAIVVKEHPLEVSAVACAAHTDSHDAQGAAHHLLHTCWLPGAASVLLQCM
jgi:hypothetical protein